MVCGSVLGRRSPGRRQDHGNAELLLEISSYEPEFQEQQEDVTEEYGTETSPVRPVAKDAAKHPRDNEPEDQIVPAASEAESADTARE